MTPTYDNGQLTTDARSNFHARNDKRQTAKIQRNLHVVNRVV